MTCTCHEAVHRQDCPEGRAEQARLRRRAAEVQERLERRAVGARIFASEARALAWYYQTREAWGAPKGIPLEAQSGPPGRGAASPARALFAQIAYAIGLAVRYDLELHPSDPAPIARWLAEHHGAGRSYVFLAEEGNVSVDHVKRRMGRVHRRIRERLAQGGVLVGAAGELRPVQILEEGGANGIGDG